MGSSILLVDDDPGMIQVMGRILSGIGQLRFATSGTAALKQARELPTDLMLLDAEMPGMTGYQVCEIMKADPALRDIPVIFVTAHSGDELELKGLEIGAVDFIAKPISEPLLLARVRTQLRVKHLTDELRRIATIDALTEVSNRRTFDEALGREWKRCLRARIPLSLVMVDVDHFKLFNDHYGHPAGDGCLRSIAQALHSACMRPADLVARYGGEEFVLLLPHTPRAGAELMGARVHSAIALLSVPHEMSPTAPCVTVSVGIGYHDEQSASWAKLPVDSRGGVSPACTAHDLVRCADQALYEAKRRGRARTWQRDIDDINASGRAHPTGPPGSGLPRTAP
jgi:diguanylate cyclase (GGDEF)-like protein